MKRPHPMVSTLIDDEEISLMPVTARGFLINAFRAWGHQFYDRETIEVTMSKNDLRTYIHQPGMSDDETPL
jgi:hypothetical protein